MSLLMIMGRILPFELYNGHIVHVHSMVKGCIWSYYAGAIGGIIVRDVREWYHHAKILLFHALSYFPRLMRMRYEWQM